MAVVRLHMLDGTHKDYQCQDRWTALYIKSAKQKSIEEKRDDAHFVIGGEVLEWLNT